MNKIVLDKWIEFQNAVSKRKDKVTREALLKDLFLLMNSIKEIADSNVKSSYMSYLAYFEQFRGLNYKLYSTPWYSLDELIEYEILKPTIQNPVIIISELLGELLIFRSNKRCPVCQDQDLKVFVDEMSNIFYECDNCTCLLDKNGTKQQKVGKLSPAPLKLISDLNIEVSSL